jgi:hypothetical protein
MLRRRLASKPRRFGAQLAVAFDLAAQAVQVAVFFGGGDFVGFHRQDLVQDVGHDKPSVNVVASASLTPSQTNRPPVTRFSQSDTVGLSLRRALAWR